MHEVKKFVITGGACAGKSSVLKALEQSLGEQVVFATEIATILLFGGFPRRETPSWQGHFQRVVNAGQQSIEQIHTEEALERGAKGLICDRGIFDGAAYSGGVEHFCELYKLDLQAGLKAYTAVYHLESLATAYPEMYGTAGNPHRYETLEQAQALEHATRAAWDKHPNYVFVGGSNLERKIEIVTQGILQHLGDTI